jgi:hypothetical protein
MTEKPEKHWKELRFYQKFKYVAEILAIAGGLIVIILYLCQLTIFKKQLKFNEEQLDFLAASLNLERSKSKAQLECRIWRREFNASLTLKTQARMETSSDDDRTQAHPKQNDTNKASSKAKMDQDDRTRIILICRNLSHRPTAVIDVYLRDDKGDHLGGGAWGYKNQINLPFSVEPWGLTAIDFKIDIDDEKRMKDISIRDMEDYQYEVSLRSGWTGPKQKAKSK